MSVARLRERHMRWCRYLSRAEMPFDRWQHRAPGCDDPRPSGVVRAWEALFNRTSRGWPWKPHFRHGMGLYLKPSALMSHDLPRRPAPQHEQP